MVGVDWSVAVWASGVAQLELVVPGLRAQLVGVKLPPVGLLLKLTVPRGADFVPLSVSVTVAVQVVEDRKSVVEGKRVDLGGGRIIKKKKSGVVVVGAE